MRYKAESRRKTSVGKKECETEFLIEMKATFDRTNNIMCCRIINEICL